MKAGKEIVKRVEDTAKRIKNDDSAVFTRIIHAYRNDVQRRIGMLEQQIKIIERAQELIKNCSYEELSEMVTVSMLSSSTSS